MNLGTLWKFLPPSLFWKISQVKLGNFVIMSSFGIYPSPPYMDDVIYEWPLTWLGGVAILSWTNRQTNRYSARDSTIIIVMNSKSWPCKILIKYFYFHEILACSLLLLTIKTQSQLLNHKSCNSILLVQSFLTQTFFTSEGRLWEYILWY